MNITGKVRIFRNEYNGKTTYVTSIKNKIGNQDCFYKIPVTITGNREVLNGHIIDIKNGFLSFYYDKNNLPKLKAIVMDFEEVEQSNSENTNNILDIPFEVTQSEDLPF